MVKGREMNILFWRSGLLDKQEAAGTPVCVLCVLLFFFFFLDLDLGFMFIGKIKIQVDIDIDVFQGF